MLSIQHVCSILHGRQIVGNYVKKQTIYAVGQRF